MLRGTILTLLAAAAALTPPATAASPPEGRPCTFLVTDAGTGEWTGYLAGGPVAAPGSAVAVRCSIHVGNASHTGPAVAEAAAGPAPGVVAVATPVSYAADPDATHVVCTEATVDGTAWYWTGAAWTTDQNAGCPVSLTAPTEELWDDVAELLTCVGWCYPFPPPDDVLCSAFAALAGTEVPGVVEIEPDGDIRVADGPFWDCPPYDEWPPS